LVNEISVWEYLFRKFTNYLPYKSVGHPPTMWKCVMEPLNIHVPWQGLILMVLKNHAAYKMCFS